MDTFLHPYRKLRLLGLELTIAFLKKAFMTNLQRTFIKNLRAERKRLGFSQELMAEKSGISHSFYQAIEGGTKFPSVEKIESLARAVGVPPYRLFVEAVETKEMLPTELIDRYNDYLREQVRNQLPIASAEFLKGMKAQE